MAGEEAGDLVDGRAQEKAGVLPEAEHQHPSPHCPHEYEPGLYSPRSLSFASANDASFQSSSTSASDVSLPSSAVTSAGSDGDMYRRMQSEYEEIPSFRWIATPLRWWRTRKGTTLTSEGAGAEEEMRGKMVHFSGHLALTFEDLMAASAEVLGNDRYGSVYKVTLEDGSRVAVRRVSRVAIASEFEAAVRQLGEIRHSNLLALRACYCSQDEEPLVFDYMPGSLSTVLLDTPTRMSMGIEVGITRIPHYLYIQKSMVHGNSTSRNARLDEHTNAKLADYKKSKLWLPFRAYYSWPQREKLLVFDYMPKGSLSAFLHARDPGILKDWPTRMNIAIGISRGLHYLHVQKGMVHGNLNSGKILLDDSNNAQIADYGLSRFSTAAANSRVRCRASKLGYHAPELSNLKDANTSTDVYSLGVILLELLTGKSPRKAIHGLSLPRWVALSIKDEWADGPFDHELMTYGAGATTIYDILDTVNLALRCVHPSPHGRPGVGFVLETLETILSKIHPNSCFDDSDSASQESEICGF
uniref:Probably inactive leucine-rich repeat receptor-like protein kinase IMK2 n=1 Tax=Anthurium amnicola TaxID=1678845 RepID=A0A1D1ZER3_9ARAE